MDSGMYMAPRAYFLFKYFGATSVRYMNGGLKKWVQLGYETHSGEQQDVNNTEEGDYSYTVVDQSKAVLNIAKIHKVAKDLHNNNNEV
jgi:3-mercaptopyruvate sulfurtransferase SseA